METLQIISLSLGIVMTGFSLLTLFSEKFRDKILKSKDKKQQEQDREEQQKETDRCLLRDAILANYRIHKDAKEWTVDDYENFKHLYEQYKKLNGNSFVDKLWKIVQTWKITM